MLDKYLPVFGILGVGLLIFGYFTISVPRDASRKDAITFSNTSMWDQEMLDLLKRGTLYPSHLFVSILLPPPPKNSSQKTANEVRTLMSLGTSRTPEKIQDIIAEINLETTYFNGRVLKDYIDENEFPATAALLAESFHDLTVVVLQQKQKFDRVRPNKLDPTLETVIAVPGHPAYPSGHSTQMHFIAYVFAELAPARRAEFVARADQIAHNREIAGLHYPSDSAAGVLLAQQFFDIMMQNEKFKTLLAAAKKEWATHPELVQALANP